MESGVPEWPNFDIPYDIPHSSLKVYGGAQYARLLTEFQYVSHSREFPRANLSEVACSLGSSFRVSENAASNLVSKKAKQILLPLVDILLQRAIFIMRHLFKVALNVIKEFVDDTEVSILTEYKKFIGQLYEKYNEFLKELFADCSRRLKDDFVMFSAVMDWDFSQQAEVLCNKKPVQKATSQVNINTNTEESQKAETKHRVENLMRSSQLERKLEKRSKLDEEGFQALLEEAATKFGTLRFVFTKFVLNKMQAFFMDPMSSQLGKFIIDSFYNLPHTSYENMFCDGVEEMKTLQGKLKSTLESLSNQRDKFKEMYFKMKNAN